MDTPELEKLKALQPKCQVIGEFLEWLGSNDMRICRYASKADERDDEGLPTDVSEGDLFPVYDSTEKLIANCLKIDLNKVDAEKRQLLEELRKVKQYHCLEDTDASHKEKQVACDSCGCEHSDGCRRGYSHWHGGKIWRRDK
jgi:hypothetical protein